MVHLKFVGDPKAGQRTYRSGKISCDLDKPDTCDIMVPAKQAAQILKDHPTWFRMKDDVDLDKATSDELNEAKSLAKILPLVDALALNRTKKILYMTSTLEIPVSKNIKVGELDVLLKSHYGDNDLE